MDMTAVNLSTLQSQARLAEQVSISVARKAMDTDKMQAASMLKLMDQAVEMSQSPGASGKAPLPGGRLDLLA